MTRAEREAKLLPRDAVPTRNDLLALYQRLANTQSALARCRERNTRLRAERVTTAGAA